MLRQNHEASQVEVLKSQQDEATAFGEAFLSLEILADLLFLVVGYSAILSQMEVCSEGKLEELLLPWFSAMYWLRFAYSLRGELWLGPHLLPILSAMRDTGAFFFLTFLCVVASTHAYIILNPRGVHEISCGPLVWARSLLKGF